MLGYDIVLENGFAIPGIFRKQESGNPDVKEIAVKL